MLEDPLFWLFVLPGTVLGLYAQWRIKTNVTKYSQVPTLNGVTGAEVARRLLDAQGLQNVKVESTPGMLSDHYDPRAKVLRLSEKVYHVQQDAEDYFPMEARTYIVPVVQLAAQAAPWVFVLGLMLQMPVVAWTGVIMFGSSSFFALLTLPVEFNASKRAQELLVRYHIIQGEEQEEGVAQVLSAAAWTYVAAAVSALGVWIFYIFVLLRGRSQ